ncbi:Zn-dependent exopeptidase [Hypoxylon sp. NC0597]|nr:Zn-dependent exopeptidase [Hypoxylon sp. NC0597]
MRALSQKEAEKLIVETPKIENLRTCSKLYSAKPHLAGDLQHAERICDLWRSYGIHTELSRYDVLQNFPRHSALSLHREDGSIAFNASLVEDEIAEDPTSSPQNGLPAFFGFGAHGTVHGELVYANFGTLSDFQLLESKGISVKGKIVICKYSKVFRGLKVRAAERFGAIGVIIYNDPQEDGKYTVKNGYKPYPHGPARHPKSIQRGSVDFFSVSVGDPTTPGYPSLPGEDTERREPKHAIPSIPALPISFSDAIQFLRALNGQGLSPDEIGGEGSDWQGALDNIDYWTGPSKAKVTLQNEGDYCYSPIYNVIGTIEGLTDETVILGNHHDSWSNGAIDPVSGSAAMNEVARGLGGLLKSWKPYRKIVLASWDNEEYGLVGSTEFGEHHAAWLTENCVAYINVDEATNGGNILGAYGSPLLAYVLRDAAKVIPSPINDGRTVYDDWLHLQRETADSLEEPNLTVMGTGSDYTVFFHHLGISSLDMLFNQKGTSVYPYHSNYDSYYWVEKFGDPGFKKHLAMARLFGLLTVKLAGIPVLPFRASDYADALKRHTRSLRNKDITGLILEPLETSVSKFEATVKAFDLSAHKEELDISHQPRSQAKRTNKIYMKLERSFLREKGGLPGRPWYKHLIFAPGLWAGYDGVAFPGITECLENGDVEGANGWIQEVAEVIDRASSLVQSAQLD